MVIGRRPGSGAPFAGEQLSNATVGIPGTEGLQAPVPAELVKLGMSAKAGGTQQKGSHPPMAVAKAEHAMRGLGLSWVQSCCNSCLQAMLLRAGLGLESYLHGRAARETNAQNSQDHLVPTHPYRGIQVPRALNPHLAPSPARRPPPTHHAVRL